MRDFFGSKNMARRLTGCSLLICYEFTDKRDVLYYERYYYRDRKVANDMRSIIIAEVAQAHDGSLGTAHSYIDAVARTGADAIKFQTHIAATESSELEEFRVKFSKQDLTRYDYWKRMEFTKEQWHGLANHAREKA